MKKIIVILMAAFVLLTVSVSAFATNGGFVSSPSNNQAPELLDVKSGFEDCTSKFAVMSYADRDQLSEEARKALEDAYASIKETADLTSLNDAIATVAKKLGVDASHLAVSDLFDLAPKADAELEDGDKYDFSVKADTLENFVCLLHYVDGKWEVVEDAEVSKDGENLEFEVDGFSPIAVAVSTGDEPQYGGITAATIIGIMALVVGVGGIGVAAWYALVKFDVIKLKKS
jgi:hypothetical protein